MKDHFEEIEILIRNGWRLKELDNDHLVMVYPNSSVEFIVHENKAYFKKGNVFEKFTQRTLELDDELRIVQIIARETHREDFPCPKPKI